MSLSPRRSPTRDGKKKISISKMIKKKIARSFSGTEVCVSSSGDETLVSADNSQCVEIDLDMAAKAVPMAEDRVAQVIAQSPYLSRRNRRFDVPSFTPDDFEVGKRLAHGGFANVHRLEQWNCDCDLNEEENVGKEYVVKTLRVDQATSVERLAASAADMVLEAYVMTTLDHPNILKLRGMSNKGLHSLKRGRVDGFFLMFDYLPVTLNRQLSKWKKQHEASVQQRLQSAVQMASALEYMHSKHIIYRDLKPSNAGYTKEGILQLFDFGLAVEIPPTSDPDKLFNMAGKKGTPR